MGNELTEYLKRYSAKYEDGFPMIPLASGRTDAEIIAIIQECLSKGKDVYELGYVEDGTDFDY